MPSKIKLFLLYSTVFLGAGLLLAFALVFFLPLGGQVALSQSVVPIFLVLFTFYFPVYFRGFKTYVTLSIVGVGFLTAHMYLIIDQHTSLTFNSLFAGAMFVLALAVSYAALGVFPKRGVIHTSQG
tara:strand:- start:52787 stop:53164 length:378 start_codon:yes stop_codon:yes gene_type:complete